MDAVADEWKENNDAWLADIAARRDAGEVSEEEVSPLVNLERTVIVYDLMMGGALEKCGRWLSEDPAACGASALETLAERVAPMVAHDSNKLRDALQTAYSRGNLECGIDRGTVEWRWAEFV